MLIYILYPVIALFFVLLFCTFLLAFQQMQSQWQKKYMVMQVAVPRENESGPIVAETIFATFHGVEKHFTLWQRLRGFSSDNISFELANVGNSIQFYLAFPKSLRSLIEGQVYAQYPNAEIEECPDYSKQIKREEQKTVISMELDLFEANVYPIKRYAQFEDKLSRLPVDPLAGITAALVTLNNPKDQVWVQIVVTPLLDKWRIIFTKCVRILQNGVFSSWPAMRTWYARAFTTRKTWAKIVLFPLYAIFWLHGLLVNSKIELSSGQKVAASEMEEMISKSHDRESNTDAAMDKVLRPLFNVNIRLVYLSDQKDDVGATQKLKELAATFKQFNFPHMNGFEVRSTQTGTEVLKNYSHRLIKDGFVLNNEELATIYHLPYLTVKTPLINWVKSKRMEPPADLPIVHGDVHKIHDGTVVLGKTNFRGSSNVFGIKDIDRRRHFYIIGKTGMGKSTLLENMIYSDIQAGHGVGVIDPHGDLADRVLNFVPTSRINDVMLIDPSDKEYAVAFNMLDTQDPSHNGIVASGLIGIFKKIYAESWGPRLEHILRNTVLALLESPGATLLGIPKILVDADFRKKVLSTVQDPMVLQFWHGEFANFSDKLRVEAISPIQNKVGQFLSGTTIRNIVGQPKTTIDFRFAMDKGKIVIINLSKGKIGEDNSALLGAMFVTKFQLDAMSRADILEKDRKDFHLYIDEFQNFATDSFATILSEARKYRLSLTIANQYIAQMPDTVREAVFGNVGSMLSYQVGFDDAETISQQFAEEVTAQDVLSLNKYSAYMRLLIDGMPSKTFSLDTLPPPPFTEDPAHLDKILKVNRQRYSQPVEIVEEKINRFTNSMHDKKARDD